MKDGLSWVTNDKQSDWLDKYLDRKQIMKPSNLALTPKERIKARVNAEINPWARKQLISSMRAAWNKAQSRKKRESEGYASQSMEIPKSAQQKLKTIAKNNNCSQSETISRLIEDSSQLTASLSEKIKECNEQIADAKLQVKTLTRTKLTGKIKSLDDAIKHIKVLEETVLAQRRTMTEYTVKLQDAEIFDDTLTKSQKEKVSEKYKKAIDTLKQKKIIRLLTTDG
ncbi:hypothetical protein TUM4644_34490 [Shewanella colwelliana]|uniref:hypothetical protein n=1 Tax=Shewanella colwelliana TaxID=23 RepID=UPI001BC3F3C1|nr:hypothetical protein [Shewanella colwelliana]GIU33623.1 hypothetical protein TUM4644_34490 [Shewanella colwelliana]